MPAYKQLVTDLFNNLIHDYTAPTHDTILETGFAVLGLENWADAEDDKYLIYGNIIKIYQTNNGQVTKVLVSNVALRSDYILILNLDTKFNVFTIDIQTNQQLLDDLEENYNHKYNEVQIKELKEFFKTRKVISYKDLIQISKSYGWCPVSSHYICMDNTILRELIIAKVINSTPKEIVEKVISDLTSSKYKRDHSDEEEIAITNIKNGNY